KPPENHWKKRFPELEKELLDTYYRFKGWNEDGIPTKESLHELGLDYVYEDFEKRGIYSGNGDTPPSASAEKEKEV
ncbi:MAG TPA: aldehyde ferredoxin oxidoreductase C-terminal domain-containing protein, partial [Thermodesulfobacteriota bacterium]|nr:aldehyde ferredoxin oxidoreductase C-terminal domain-containing protein [Thermodesulfobacteriota bacterium]